MSKLHEVDLGRDIRYRGPLSYREFMILGWLCIVLGQALRMMNLGVLANGALAGRFAAPMTVLQFVTDMSLPLLLLANFARILNKSRSYRSQLIVNGAAMLGFAALFLLVFNHYVIGTVSVFATDRAQVPGFVMQLFYMLSGKGFIAFNFFVDIFLCTLVMFFLDYKPKKVFTGRWHYLFRAFALLPIAYEVASFAVKYLAAAGQIKLPLIVFPFLTVKPPMTFLVFVVLALFIKLRERRFCRHGRGYDEYEAFLQTNRNSLHFAIFLAVLLVVASLLDVFAYGLFGGVEIALQAGPEADLEAYVAGLDLENYRPIALQIGVGQSAGLILLAPLVLLFSYSRVHKNRLVDTAIPVAGVALIVLVTIQGLYQILHVLDLPRFDLNELRAMFDELMLEIQQGT